MSPCLRRHHTRCGWCYDPATMTVPAVSQYDQPTRYGRIRSPVEAWLAKQPPEPILDPELPIIDTHHHLWDRRDHRDLLHELLPPPPPRPHPVATPFVECRAMYPAAGPPPMRPVGETELAPRLPALR